MYRSTSSIHLTFSIYRRIEQSSRSLTSKLFVLFLKTFVVFSYYKITFIHFDRSWSDFDDLTSICLVWFDLIWFRFYELSDSDHLVNLELRECSKKKKKKERNVNVWTILSFNIYLFFLFDVYEKKWNDIKRWVFLLNYEVIVDWLNIFEQTVMIFRKFILECSRIVYCS